MEALERMIKNFLALDPNKILIKTMSDNPILEKLAIQLVQRKQLDFGLTGDGHFLGEYSAVSVEVFGKEPGPINLDDTGEFRDSFEVVLVDEGFFINADGQKEDTNLFVEFGSDITKLNEDNLSTFIDRLVPLMQKAIIELMFKNV